ncbi:MAG TPA: aspartate aminotransferase family protein [Bryobacteraceae bacterium]|nr:aspartate aminotransferase family protein [Bryobacteraceae bacterium]
MNQESSAAVEAKQCGKYRSATSVSRQLHERAMRVMPGGNTRHSIALAPYPVYVASGTGCHVTDVEGEERIDFLNNYTSLILGHADPRVTAAVQQRAALGTAFTMPAETQVELAELLVERVPYIDQVRFANSGSEAVMLAIKAARAFTGRHKIAKFEGAYHGIYDYAQVSDGPSAGDWGELERPARVIERGAPPSQAEDVVVMPWNHFEICRELIRSHRDQLAAVLVDPLPLGIGLIAAKSGFLQMLREETARHGILMISDEVLTFRLSYRGAMHAYGISPDLTALAKIIGGGFPVGAVAGAARVMSVFDHTRDIKVHHGGTFNANPVTMTAGLETMRQMTPQAYERLEKLGDSIREKLARMLRDRGTPAQVCGRGSLFLAHLTGEELTDYRSISGFSRSRPPYVDLCHHMLAHGIVTSPRGMFGCLSTPMAETELAAFVEALDRSLDKLG